MEKQQNQEQSRPKVVYKARRRWKKWVLLIVVLLILWLLFMSGAGSRLFGILPGLSLSRSKTESQGEEDKKSDSEKNPQTREDKTQPDKPQTREKTQKEISFCFQDQKGFYLGEVNCSCEGQPRKLDEDKLRTAIETLKKDYPLENYALLIVPKKSKKDPGNNWARGVEILKRYEMEGAFQVKAD